MSSLNKIAILISSVILSCQAGGFAVTNPGTPFNVKAGGQCVNFPKWLNDKARFYQIAVGEKCQLYNDNNCQNEDWYLNGTGRWESMHVNKFSSARCI